jgi:hypothetical protein
MEFYVFLPDPAGEGTAGRSSARKPSGESWASVLRRPGDETAPRKQRNLRRNVAHARSWKSDCRACPAPHRPAEQQRQIPGLGARTVRATWPKEA